MTGLEANEFGEPKNIPWLLGDNEIWFIDEDLDAPRPRLQWERED